MKGNRKIFRATFKDYAKDNISKVNYEVDFVFTHTCPTTIVKKFMFETNQNKSKFNDPTTIFLEDICLLLKFKEWHYGHLHHNYLVTNKDGLFACHYKIAPVEIF